ncbi:DsbA family protein [Roseomonas sp. OT10]|uniref:DsbA family protein n=1 Tax=Roseomonas cutis TaxID=2897332 RepID=UPI001E29F917|nr:thioredoxin domain-containing protein [Roseomonas sp. OT10]UFN51266.1 DsbA family protein [Roseomonas sp. OT10]
MTTPRRAVLLAAALGAPALLSLDARAQGSAPAAPAAGDPRLAERAAGKADAPVTVIEYFSLTCSHCAAFHKETWPKVRSELVETGKIRMVWRDFPLDQLALAAATVARSLPPQHYEAFISALLGSQDRWAFARGINNLDEIAKIAALTGMTRAQFDAAIADQGLQRAILEGRMKAEQEFQVNSTPTFVFGRKPVPGALSFDRFAEQVRQAAPG